MEQSITILTYCDKKPIVLKWILVVSSLFMMVVFYWIMDRNLQQYDFDENLKELGYLQINKKNIHELSLYVKKDTGEVLIGSIDYPLIPVSSFVKRL